MHSHHYRHLAIMTVLSFIAMYVLIYAMVDRFENVFPNVNQASMAGLMTAPMVIIELIVMRAILLIRQQTAVGDVQFLKSMIPHHGAAVLMCEKAPITDAEIKTLCKSIISGQSSEIAQMKTILGRMGR